MAITLPTPLAAYFAAANAHDTDAVLACFAADARVRDEGKDLVGRDAIVPNCSAQPSCAPT